MSLDEGQLQIKSKTSMNPTGYMIHVKKRILFLQAVIDHYCGNAFISFEGDLSSVDFRNIAHVSEQPTGILCRNTLQPQQDFVILPLEENTVEEIKKRFLNQIGLEKKVDHILIAQNEKLVVGIYDRFHPESVWVSKDIPESTLRTLMQNRVIATYTPVEW